MRGRHNARTVVTHVRSHTGLRDKASLGNASADRLAGWQVHRPSGEDDDTGQAHEAHNMANELPYCLALSSWSAPDKDGKQTETIRISHGDVRRAIRDLLHDQRVEEWKARKVRGSLARSSWTDTNGVIKRTWCLAPNSNSIQCIMRCLNSVDHKEVVDGEWTTSTCDRCGTGHPCTAMGDLQCPANDDLWNDLDDELADNHLYINGDDDDRAPTDLVQATETAHHAICAAGRNGAPSGDNAPNPCKIRFSIAGGHPPAILSSRDIRPLAALYVLTEAKKARELSSPDTHGSQNSSGEGDETNPPSCPLVPTTLTTDVPLLSSYIARTSVGRLWGPERWQCEWLRKVSRRFLRTYSDLYAHPLNSNGLWSTRWRSDDPTASMLGATIADAGEFIQNSYTWSCLGPENKEALELVTAVSSVAASTGRARVALLIRDTETMRVAIARVAQELKSGAGHRTRARTHVHALVKIGPGMVDVTSMHDRQWNPHPTKNADPLALVIVDSHDAPGVDIEGLKRAIGPTGTVTPPPWGGHALPDDGPDDDRLSEPRHHPLARPSLCWYRNDVPAAQRQDDDPPAPHPTCTMNRTLGALGAVPRTLLRDAKSIIVPNQPFITTEKRKTEISKIVLRTAQEAHRRAENWRKWRRKQ